MYKRMEDESMPFNVTLDVTEADDITRVFLGYETADGMEIIIASAEPPAHAELTGTRPGSDGQS